MDRKFNRLAEATVLGLFLHTFFIVYYFPYTLGLSRSVASLLAFWKEIAMFCLITGIVFNRVTLRQPIIMTKTSALIVLYFIHGLFYVFVAQSTTIGLYGLRNEFEYFLMYFIGSNLNYQLDDLKRFTRSLLWVATFIAIWGIVQPLTLGDSFLMKIGYGDGDRLDSAFYIANFLFQRAVSTFASPNELGAFLMVVLLLLIPLRLHKVLDVSGTRFNIALGALAVCFMYSVSRSAWVGFFAGLFYLAIHLKNKRLYYAMACAICVAIVLFIITGVIDHFVNTITMRDPSASAHLGAYSAGAKFIAVHPFGVGMGMAGPKSAVFLKEKFTNSESSYLVVCFETGLVGFSILMAILTLNFSTLAKFCKSSGDPALRLFALGIAASFIAVLVQYIFLPTIQELAVPSFVWFLSGLVVQFQCKARYQHV